jgi:hypothetical protein
MQTISTKYVGPSNTKGSRIIATTAWVHHRLTISYDSSLSSEDDAHAKAAQALRDKMGWSGEMIGGHTKDGMVWVFPDEYRIPASAPKVCKNNP